MHAHRTRTREFRQDYNSAYRTRQQGAPPQQFQESQESQGSERYDRSDKVKIGQDYYDEVGDAKDRDAYYSSVKDRFDTDSPQDLYRDLNKLVTKTHRPLGYSEARKDLYSLVDRRPDGGLYYIYSGDGPKNEGDVKAPADHELSNYNCEHVVPQSWFHKKGTPRGDLNHLFTEQVQCNGSRGNLPMGEDNGSGESLPMCGIVEHEGPHAGFEPHAGKGEIARATLYFITRYPGEVGDSDRETQPADIQQLIKWSKEYPVTDYERHRNDTIQDVQGNRNPFIDFPQLVDKVDFNQGIGRAS